MGEEIEPSFKQPSIISKFIIAERNLFGQASFAWAKLPLEWIQN
jgi:hypothetical protein